MLSQRTESPVRPTRPTPGVLRRLAVALALATVAATLFFPTESRADSCYCPDGADSQGNPVTSTTCGEQICGADLHWYSCQESGWSFEGGSCGDDPASCSCTGTDHLGNTVTVNACGQQVCGADFQHYSCGETGWTALGTSCPDEIPPPSCYCPDGVDYLGNPVAGLACGEQVCGADFQYYSCGETGWSAQGTSCPEEDAFVNSTFPTPSPLDSITITTMTGIHPAEWGINPVALHNQIALSNVRVRYGRARHTLDTLPATASQAQRDAAEDALEAAQEDRGDLQLAESLFPSEQIERARLPVFLARLIQLETQYASLPGYAVQLARQTYYNGEMYAAGSGAPKIPFWLIDMTGLPHGEVHPDGNGGYIASIRAPNGQQVDFGHLLCAVDFNAPYPRAGSLETVYRNYQHYNGTPLPNPVNHGGMVSLAGDLGTASNDYMTNGNDAWAALMNQGHSDMRGDVDGLNLSAILTQAGWAGPTPVASTLMSYYYGSGSETYMNRAQLFRDTSEYVWNLGAFGYVISPWLYEDVNSVATVFSLFGRRFDGALGTPYVVQAFETWLNLELAGLNPLTDG